jgi:hypothetical protein
MHVAVAALIPWAYKYVLSSRSMCALHKLKFDYIAFIQAFASLSYYRSVMDKNIWTVTAPDKAISPDISEPFHFSNHLVFFPSTLASETVSS